MFDSREPNVVELCTTQAVLEKMAYTLNNPVSSGAVKYRKNWPGVLLGPGKLIRVKRPRFYFRAANPNWHDELELEVRFPDVGDQSCEEFVRNFDHELARAEQAAQVMVCTRGQNFLGRKRVRRLSPYSKACSERKERRRSPTFAVGRGNAHVLRKMARARRIFRQLYREALEKRRSGEVHQFPEGTWWMRVFHNAKTVPIGL